MKGQMFLLAAFIIASTLAVLRVSLKSPSIQEEIKVMEMTLEHDMANNFVEELKNSAKFSIDQKANITRNVFDFANFTERRAYEHSLDFEFLFVGSLANHTNSSLYVSLINMLSNPINASLNLNGVTYTNEVADNVRWDTSFPISPGDDYVLTVGYNSTYSESVTVKTKNNKDVYIGFFDVKFETPLATYTNKTQETYNLDK